MTHAWFGEAPSDRILEESYCKPCMRDHARHRALPSIDCDALFLKVEFSARLKEQKNAEYYKWPCLSDVYARPYSLRSSLDAGQAPD